MTGSIDRRARDLLPLIAMFVLYFLVICAVGILRPIKDSLALDGLAHTAFYQVYLVSAVVVLFVPLYNRLAARIPWRTLIPASAMFFVVNLIIFRLVYREGSTAFGLIFYGWYDLFAAALVTQFFITTQLFFNSRAAKRAYPIVIAGGSIGATLGGAITALFAERVGTPNLILVAAAIIAVFAIGLPLVWRIADVDSEPRRNRSQPPNSLGEDIRALFQNPHVRLIASMVLMMVVAKQLVDYQFKTITAEVIPDLDARSAFLGKFGAATQWLPLIALVALRPALARFGIAAAVLALPVALALTNVGLLLFFGLWTAAAAKGAENSLRYAAERAGREILYIPLPEDVKLRTKTYIDVAIEKGVGKVLSGLLIPVLLLFMDYSRTAWAGLVISLVWFAFALRARGEYVRTLASSIEGRFASLRGALASLLDANTIPVVRQALVADDPRRVSFALDLVAQAPAPDTRAFAPELRSVLAHDAPDLRARALELLERAPAPEDWEAIRERLQDPDESVREAAVRALFAKRSNPGALVEQLLASPEPVVRTAVLGGVARGEVGPDGVSIARRFYTERLASLTTSDVETRCELALAAGALAADDAPARLRPFLDDADARVASTALRSAALLKDPQLYPRLVQGLAKAGTREAARDALVRLGPDVVPFLGECLMDPETNPVARRALPSVLARIPSQGTVEALIQLFLAPETDQVLDYRTMKALSSLRARHPELAFDARLLERPIAREADAAARYAEARGALHESAEGVPALLRAALLESWRERRETTFRALGLVHPQQETFRAYLALGGTQSLSRANALEWLETRTGYQAFQQLAPVLTEPGTQLAGAHRTNGRGVLDALTNDDDPWIALLARNIHAPSAPGSDGMDTIEKVFLLQNVDLLREARSAHLAILASIAEELDVPAGTRVLREGEPTDALYVVVKGAVELRGMGGTLLAAEGQAFGTWALIDQSPSVVEAKTRDPSRLLRITRDDFQDLVADHPELAIGLLQGLARRMRTIVS